VVQWGWASQFEVCFAFEGARYRSNYLYQSLKEAQAAATKLQAVFDKGQAGT